MTDEPETERRLAELEAEFVILEAALAKLRAEMDMLLAEREALNKSLKKLSEEDKQRDREAPAPLPTYSATEMAARRHESRSDWRLVPSDVLDEMTARLGVRFDRIEALLERIERRLDLGKPPQS